MTVADSKVTCILMSEVDHPHPKQCHFCKKYGVIGSYCSYCGRPQGNSKSSSTTNGTTDDELLRVVYDLHQMQTYVLGILDQEKEARQSQGKLVEEMHGRLEILAGEIKDATRSGFVSIFRSSYESFCSSASHLSGMLQSFIEPRDLSKNV